MIESDLRFLIREMLNEADLYRDDAGYQFKIIGGKLHVVKGPKGPFRPPRLIPDDKLKDAIKKLNPNDAELQALLKKPVPKTQDTIDADDDSSWWSSWLPSLPSWLGGGDDENDAEPQDLSNENIIHPELAKLFPNFKLSDLDAGFLGNKNPRIGYTSVKNCSEWAKAFVGWQGNAWYATKKGNVKFNLFSDLGLYKTDAENLLRKINKTKNVGPKSAENSAADNLLRGILPAPITVSSQMKYGDVVGIYHAGSKHAAEAFFASALGYSIPRNEDQASSKNSISRNAKVLIDGKAYPWSPKELGKDRRFIIFNDFPFNTHVGFVGALYGGRPVIFHNAEGNIHAFIAENPDDSDVPVWVKSPTRYTQGVPAKV